MLNKQKFIVLSAILLGFGCGSDDESSKGTGGADASTSGGSAGQGASGGSGGNAGSGGSGGKAGSGGAAGAGGNAGSGSGGVAGASSGGSAGSGGTSAAESCVFEAENYSSQKGYAKVSHSGASGGIAMQVGASGSLNFELNLKVGGRYYVWLRTQAPNSESNGLFISIDGKRIKAPADHKLTGVSDIYLKKGSNWFWTPEWQGSSHSGPITFDIKPGKHTFSIEKRKIERPLIDKLVINKSKTPPTGKGPAEQACK